MLRLLFYLCTFIFSVSIAMEKPLQKSLFASSEIVQQAFSAVTNDHLKRLKKLLETYTFDQETMKKLLKSSMGDKQFDREFIGAFVLLLQHGAPLDSKITVAGECFDEPLYDATFLEYAEKEYPRYSFFLYLFGAKPLTEFVVRYPDIGVDQQNIQIGEYNSKIGVFEKYGKTFLRSQTTGRPIPLAQAREYFSRYALTHCRTYQEAVRHEDLEALKLLLSKPFVGSVQEKYKQLCFAVDAALTLESTSALDELAKHGAPVAERLNLHFLFHPELIEHCARNRYITLQDLGAYKTRIPENPIGSMWSWTQQQFETHIARLNAAINSAMRLLERQELQELETYKKSRIEKKDE